MEKLYENIKIYREARGMSQEELAKKTGYTDRSSIAKIEKGLVDLQQSKILSFSRALDIPVLDLMGWNTDRTPSETIEAVELMRNANEREMLAKYRALDPYDKGRVDQFVDDLLKKKNGMEDNIDVG